MVAVTLFDILAGIKGAADSGSPAADRLAQKLVESSLSDCEKLRQYEQEFTPRDSRNQSQELEFARSIHSLFEKWAIEAEQVLTRTRPLSNAGRAVAGAAALEDAYGHICARLKLTPDQMARAMEQARQGEFTSAKELRDELRTRLRA